MSLTNIIKKHILKESLKKSIDFANKMNRILKDPEYAAKFIDDQDQVVRGAVAEHPEHAAKLINDEHPWVRGVVAKHPEHAAKLINDRDSFVRNAVAKHPEHAHRFINDERVKETAKRTLRNKTGWKRRKVER